MNKKNLNLKASFSKIILKLDIYENMRDCDSPLKFIKNISNLYKLIKICVKLENGICYPALESSKGRVPEVFLIFY